MRSPWSLALRAEDKTVRGTLVDDGEEDRVSGLQRLTLFLALAWVTLAPENVAAFSNAMEERPAGPSTATVFTHDAPFEARPAASVLEHLLDAFHTTEEAKIALKQLRGEQDALRTKLTTLTGELEVLARDRQQLQQQMSAAEAAEQARLEALRRELDAKLERELASAAQQLEQEFGEELARQVGGFDARQGGEIDKALEQELHLQERDLQQLSQEIQIQTGELRHRLSKLEVSPDVVAAMERSTSEALAKRSAELQVRRAQLRTEREARLGRQRSDFVARLRQQEVIERQRRLTVKEASLRQAMAELLQTTHAHETEGIERVQEAFERLGQRYGRLMNEQRLLQERIEGNSQAIASQVQRIAGLGDDEQTSLARLEAAFRKPDNTGLRTEALDWFGQVIGQLPPELATELGLLQQRLVVLAEQDRQLQEQQRVLRERQLAMEVSQEMETQRQQQLLKRQHEQEIIARKTDELLGKAKQFAERGRFDDALSVLSQAQGLNPPQISRVTAVRDDLIAARHAAQEQAKTAELERLFARAMEVFEQGQYEDAIALFERVIAQERGQGEQSVRFAAEGESP